MAHHWRLEIVSPLEIGDCLTTVDWILEIASPLEIGDWRLEITNCRLQIGDCLTTGDLGTSHLVNWVGLVNCLTGDWQT